jgi:hypothetical protein
MMLDSAQPTFVCQECGHRSSGQATVSLSGRRLCAGCADRLAAAADRLLTLPPKEFDGTTHADAWFAAQQARRSQPEAADL